MFIYLFEVTNSSEWSATLTIAESNQKVGFTSIVSIFGDKFISNTIAKTSFEYRRPSILLRLPL